MRRAALFLLHVPRATCNREHSWHDTLKLLQAVAPPEPAVDCKTSGNFKEDVCPSAFLPLLRIWDELNKTHPAEMSGYVQNVGANDGFYDDPLYSLISQRGVFRSASSATR